MKMWRECAQFSREVVSEYFRSKKGINVIWRPYMLKMNQTVLVRKGLENIGFS